MAPVCIVVHDAVVVEEFDLAVESVAAQVQQAAAALKDPVLEPEVHLLGPVLGMGAEHQHFVLVERHLVKVELRLSVQVVVDALVLHPAE